MEKVTWIYWNGSEHKSIQSDERVRLKVNANAIDVNEYQV